MEAWTRVRCAYICPIDRNEGSAGNRRVGLLGTRDRKSDRYQRRRSSGQRRPHDEATARLAIQASNDRRSSALGIIRTNSRRAVRGMTCV